MHPGVNARQHSTEGHAVLDMVHIGAAADGEALPLQAGHILIGLQQGLHESRIPCHTMRRNHARGAEVEAGCLCRCLRRILAVLLVGHHRGAGIEAKFHIVHCNMIEIQGAGQIMGLRILHFDAETGAVGHAVREKHRQLPKLLQHFRILQGQLQYQQNGCKARILSGLRCGGMGRNAPDNDLVFTADLTLHSAEALDFRNGLLHRLALKRKALKTKHRLLGHRIQRHTGLQRKQAGHCGILRKTLRDSTLELSLLDIDEGELTVRREGHLRLRLLLIIIGNVFGAAFLIGAHDETDALLQRNAAFLNGTHGIEGAKQRSLVVRGASAVEAAVLLHYLEGLRHGPALSGRHHIGMGQDIQRPGQALIEVRRCHIVVVILHGKAIARTKCRAELQCLTGALAEGHSRLRLALYRGNGAEIRNILQKLCLMGIQPRIYLLIHDKSSFSAKPIG